MAFQYINESSAKQTWNFTEAQIRLMREALGIAIAAKKDEAGRKGETAYTYPYVDLDNILRDGLLSSYKSMKYHAEYRLEALEAETSGKK